MPETNSTSCTPETFAPDLVALVKKSPLVFRGTVVRVGATPGFAAEPTSVVVRVDRLFADVPADRYVGAEEAKGYKSPDAVMGSLAGSEVTLVANGVAPAAGYEGYFFAESRRWGKSVELGEIARRPKSEALDAVLPRLKKALLDRDAFDRMSAADDVIVGEVTSVDPTPPPRFISEHAPLFTDAHVRVDSALHGAPGAEIVVRFSASTDICCYLSPKLAPNERAVFIAHHHDAADPALYVDRSDVLPLADEPRLRSVLACPPRV